MIQIHEKTRFLLFAYGLILPLFTHAQDLHTWEMKELTFCFEYRLVLLESEIWHHNHPSISVHLNHCHNSLN